MDGSPALDGAPFEAFSLIGGKPLSKKIVHEHRDPYKGAVVTRVHESDAADVEQALSLADAARDDLAAMTPHERAAILWRASELLEERSGKIAEVLTCETGKAIRDSKQELCRAIDVMRFCAEEAVRIEGRHIPIGGSVVGGNRIAVGLRFPVGVVLGIVPFNAPVNLACHKIGPAFAAGNAIVVKAPPQAPHCINLVVQACLDAGFPKGALALLHGGAAVGSALVNDGRVDFISFTGSHRTGLAIKAATGMRGSIMELGGVGPTIVHSDADLENAAQMCIQAGFRLAGQSCASVQNLFVHEDVIGPFTEKMLRRVKALKVGDPKDPASDFGPVIDEAAAQRIVSWVDEARVGGARVLHGGGRNGSLVEPVLITDAREDMKVVCEEVFGPVVVIRPYNDLGSVIQWIRDSGLGLNCGVFTESHAVALRMVRSAPCAAIVVNGTSTFRPEQMPYGGLRNSGYGRESPRDTIRAMTQERILVLP